MNLSPENRGAWCVVRETGRAANTIRRHALRTTSFC